MIAMRFHYTKEDVVKAIQSVGIESGDIVFSHLGLSRLGLPKTTCKDGAFFAIYDAIMEVIGANGTFLTPVYSYSFCRSEMFDPDKTPSRVGPFGEIFRKLPGVRRSIEPIFSVAGIGLHVDELFRNLPNNCFGKDCLYERLEKSNAKLCNIGFGIGFVTAMHYIEQEMNVPYRFLKLFSGFIKQQDKLYFEKWLYFVRILSVFDDIDIDKIENLAREENLSKYASIGLGNIACISFPDLFKLYRKRLKKDKLYLLNYNKIDTVESEIIRVGSRTFNINLSKNANIEEMIQELWHLPRDLVSDGYDAALKALAEQVPMNIHEYSTGMQCFTWLIPEKWTCREAYLETINGLKIFSYSNNILHTVSYSLPFSGVITREELFHHLHTHQIPNAIPFVFKYYERDWGLCCSEEIKDTLKDEQYRVKIDTDFSYGTLKVGEVIIKGKNKECIVLCAHLCHSGMVNDGLSGVAVGIEVMRELMKKSDLRYTYRFLILPETIGSAAYLSNNENLIPNMKGGLFLEMLGTNYPHALQKSYQGNSEMDLCCEMIMKEEDRNSWSDDFLKIINNDERMFNAPGIKVPMLSLSRVSPDIIPNQPHTAYKEYHSNLDTPEIINIELLKDSRDLILKIIEALEANRVPTALFKGEIFCSRFNHLNYQMVKDMIHSAAYCIDGSTSTIEIAYKLGKSFWDVKNFLDLLEHERLIIWKDL
jgi:aminopeptidase-like protein/aminoglycoside N3'-acetyltransferase